MIFGVSHVVVGTRDILATETALLGLGFQQTFAEFNLPSAPEKSCYRSTTVEQESLIYLKAAQGPALELISYGADMPENPGRFKIVISGSSPQDESAANNAIPQGVDLNVEGPDHQACVRQIIYPTRDIDLARSIWRDGLGMKENSNTSGASGSCTLEMRAAMPQWRCAVTLVSDPNPPVSSLDALGVHCLSVLSSDIERDSRMLQSFQGVSSSGPMVLNVNNQDLRLEMIELPDGGCLELLQLERSNASS